MTRVLPVGCRDCQYVEMGVCVCPWVCWVGIGEEKEAPGFQLPGAQELVCDSNSNEVE